MIKRWFREDDITVWGALFLTCLIPYTAPLFAYLAITRWGKEIEREYGIFWHRHTQPHPKAETGSMIPGLSCDL